MWLPPAGALDLAVFSTWESHAFTSWTVICQIPFWSRWLAFQWKWPSIFACHLLWNLTITVYVVVDRPQLSNTLLLRTKRCSPITLSSLKIVLSFPSVSPQMALGIKEHPQIRAANCVHCSTMLRVWKQVAIYLIWLHGQAIKTFFLGTFPSDRDGHRHTKVTFLNGQQVLFTSPTATQTTDLGAADA